MPGAGPTPEEALQLLDANAMRRWAVLIRSAYAARRAEIDALNVFPVPDGDTGTNLFLTVDGAIERTLAEDDSPTAGELLERFAAALLWTARGNSGVILSQLARGFGEVCRDAVSVDAAALAAGLARADERAWHAVTDPKEGTILSVSRAAAAAAATAVGDGLYAVSAAALEAARTALARTPEQLPVLARAGVVDAGGAGLVILIECLERLCAGDDGRVVLSLGPTDRRSRFWPDPATAAGAVVRPLDSDAVAGGEGDTGPEYEVMYLLDAPDEDAVEALRSRLVELGDSVLVVGGDGQWNVHCHVDDAGAAVEAGIEAGRPHRIRVTRLRTERGLDHEGAAAAPDESHGRALRERGGGSGIVACAAGAGLADVFRAAGAVVLDSGPRRRASTGALIDAVRKQHHRGVSGVVILPNDAETELAAAAAARAVADEGIDAHVIRSRTAVQGIAALAVFEPGAPVSANVLAMQSAASATRHGAVTVAYRSALTSGGPCEAGDVLGVVDGDIVIVGSDQAAVGREVVHRLLASGGELLTVVIGADAPAGLAAVVSAAARDEHRGVEVSQIYGGQPVYSVLLGVE
ncbi:DAK2 domain fusion protein YloV [Intrasporangium oryzae NRRL B-24470]|uniref:DAK2 domain fusion protein YloV n=1 Tax=Intrasporangium oryzae NRRL B-24470 TaxID=1386089 RepID=W9G8F9_9MICO|nr:DAK2 domain-containing protein [Intrasporangium oryzae]EWT00154.1 DAK2 domain fusion protein YloV [Intrasporangium oryzae NRRL B-24470]